MKPKKLILIFDFDGTIVKNDWPNLGKIRCLAGPVLRWIRKRGHITILSTCREGQKLEEAKDWLWENDIVFHYYNENCKELIKQYQDCRKIGGDFIFDDQAGFWGWLTVPFIVLWLELIGENLLGE